GFSPTYTTGVWVGMDDKRISLGKKETGSSAALPIWMDLMRAAHEGLPVEDFPNVAPLSKRADLQRVRVDTPDSAPTEAEEDGAHNPRPKVVKPRAKTPPPAKSTTGNGNPIGVRP